MIKLLICKLVGHKFHGYIPNKDANGKVTQEIPDKFWCLRCKSIRRVTEGYN